MTKEKLKKTVTVSKKPGKNNLQQKRVKKSRKK